MSLKFVCFLIKSRVRPLAECNISKQSGETKVDIGHSIRGKDVFIIQSCSKLVEIK